MHGQHYGGHCGGGHHMLGWILCIIVLVLAVIGLVAIVRMLTKAKNPPVLPQPKSEAIRVLEKKFAEGEIDESTYSQRLSVLSPKHST
jgi:uncharacterized membrane protein